MGTRTAALWAGAERLRTGDGGRLGATRTLRVSHALGARPVTHGVREGHGTDLREGHVVP